MIDLHIHTTASDGSFSPSEIVKKATEIELKAIAITDHDTIAGVPEALAAARKYGLAVIPGVEIGVDFDSSDIHILGCFSEKTYSGMESYFDWILQKRDKRNQQLVYNLKRAGFNISLEQMHEKAAGGTPGRPHLATCLVELGYATTIKDAFDNILLRKDIFVHREKTAPADAIGEIIKNSGIPVFAHPVYEDRKGKFELTADALVDMGIMGIEVFHSDHTQEDTQKYLKYAQTNKLLITGGSDFHGENKEDAELGRPNVAKKYYHKLVERLGQGEA